MNKPINKFAKFQTEKVKENTTKIKKCLGKIPKGTTFSSIGKLLDYVSLNTDLHKTTISKNETYMEMCKFKYHDLGGVIKGSDLHLQKEIQELKLQIASMQVENDLLRKLLKQGTGEQTNVDLDARIKQQEHLIQTLLENFKDFLMVRDGKVYDTCGGIREKELGVIK